MDKTKAIFKDEFTKSLRKGIDLVYDVVSPTLGGAGKNVLYRSPYSKAPVVTNDGKTSAALINPINEAESVGSDLIKQVAFRTDSEAGDGTTTAVVLSKAMVDKGFELMKKGKNAMILQKEISDAVTKVIKDIKDKSIPIKTDEDIFNIANISMENPDIAKIIVDAVKKAGENGTVIVDESNGLTIEKEEIEGIKFDKGYTSPFMVNNYSTMQAELKDVLILVTDKIMSLNVDMLSLIENIHSRGIKQLLIICEAFQGEALATMFENRRQGIFNCTVVQRPSDDNILQDIAVFTGAEALTSEKVSGAFTAEHFKFLGKAKKVIVSKDSTLIIGGYGEKDKVKDRVESIKQELKDKTGYVKEQLKERLAKLVGSVVILKVGAPTEAEMKYLKLKVDDAVASTRSAIEEGIVIGGGKLLYEISLQKPKTDGEKVVYYACGQPFRKILENAGLNPKDIIGRWWKFWKKGIQKGEVFDVNKNIVVKNPFKYGLIDPAKVERCAIANSASLAKTIITTHCNIIEIDTTKK